MSDSKIEKEAYGLRLGECSSLEDLLALNGFRRGTGIIGVHGLDQKEDSNSLPPVSMHRTCLKLLSVMSVTFMVWTSVSM